MDKNQLLQELQKEFFRSFPFKPKQDLQKTCHQFWSEIKSKSNFNELYDQKINYLRKICEKRKITFHNFTTNLTPKSPKQIPPIPIPETIELQDETLIENRASALEKKNECPKEKDLESKINLVNADLAGLLMRESAGQLTQEQQNNLKKLKNIKKDLESQKSKVIDNRKRQQKFRTKRSTQLKEACEENPDLKKKLKLRESIGRPSLESDQPLLLQTISELAMYGSEAHERRRMEMTKTIKTLDEMRLKLNQLGFSISRTALYYRFMPNRAATIDGKKHLNAVPVKLAKPTKNFHKYHEDTNFAKSTIDCLMELASFLGIYDLHFHSLKLHNKNIFFSNISGPHDVMLLSCDDKARVPIGTTAVNAQAPLLMHMEYRVLLPDHDFVVAERHKLIPSVYAGLIIKDKGFGQKEAVTYSGPTYVGVRSGKHDSSTAFTHSNDFNRLYNLPEFDLIMKRPDASKKPVGIILSDGGPDENPRYIKTIMCAIHHFKEHDFDALFLATNAPGRSAFNPVERRMAPLSKELRGVILPHDTFGTHLDGSKRTKDTELEKKNFKAAGEALAEIFSNISINGFDVVAEFLEPQPEPKYDKEFDFNWFDVHVRSSQYFLQIGKCDDRKCCKEYRSDIKKYLGKSFLPPQIPLKYKPNIQISPQIDADTRFASLFQNLALFDSTGICYDEYCPSISNHQIISRKCKKCAKYYTSATLMKLHEKSVHPKDPLEKEKKQKISRKRVIKRRKNEVLAVIDDYEAEWLDQDNLDISGDEINAEEPEGLQCFVNFTMDDYFACPWEEDI